MRTEVRFSYSGPSVVIRKPRQLLLELTHALVPVVLHCAKVLLFSPPLVSSSPNSHPVLSRRAGGVANSFVRPCFTDVEAS
jgi:hypothetical protein